MMLYCVFLCVCVILVSWNNSLQEWSYSLVVSTGSLSLMKMVRPEDWQKHSMLNTVIPNTSTTRWKTSRAIGAERKVHRFTQLDNEAQNVTSGETGSRVGIPENNPHKDIPGIKSFVCLLLSLVFFQVNIRAFPGVNLLSILSAGCFIMGMVYFLISQRGKKMYGVGQFTYKGFAIAAKIVLLLYGLLLNQVIWSAILVYLFF
jgi:hypothetical protein